MAGQDRVAAARKREARSRLRAVRAAIPADVRAAADEAICARVAALPEYGRCRVLLVYLSFGSEVDTRPLVGRALAEGRTVAAPWCIPGTRRMRWFRLGNPDALVASARGMMEPDPERSEEVDPACDPAALAIVPALSLDAAGRRIGYGGGFYDTFLAGFRGVSAGLCRELQVSADLAAEGLVEAHDLSVDVVVTESRTLR